MRAWAPPTRRVPVRRRAPRRSASSGSRPDAEGPPRAVAVLVHGGFWRRPLRPHPGARRRRGPVAPGLGGVERRLPRASARARRRAAGGRATFEDVAAAVDLLADVPPRPAGAPPARQGRRRRALRRRPARAVGRGPAPAARGCAGRRRRGCVREPPSRRPACSTSSPRPAPGVGNGAVVDVLGGRPRTPTPTGTRSRLRRPGAARRPRAPGITGDADESVPLAAVGVLGRRGASGGDDVTLHVEPGDGHMGHVDPASRVWSVARPLAR